MACTYRTMDSGDVMRDEKDEETMAEFETSSPAPLDSSSIASQVAPAPLDSTIASQVVLVPLDSSIASQVVPAPFGQHNFNPSNIPISGAVAEARISNLYAKMVELTASFDRMNTNKDSDTQIREASIVTTAETHYPLLDARIENGEKESKNWSLHRQRAFVKTTWRMLR